MLPILDRWGVAEPDPSGPHGLLFFFFFFFHITIESSDIVQGSPGNAMSNNSFSFWATKSDNKPDLLCGRPADYFVVQKHFTILICATIVLGGK